MAVSALWLSGCGGDPPQAPDPGETPPVVPAEGATPDTPAPASSPGNAPGAATPETSASLGPAGLPTDVFFDDPLAIYGNQTRIPGAGPASGEGGMSVAVSPPPAESTTTPEPQPEAAAVDWAEVLPADVLTAEVDRIRGRMAPNLESVATFNNSALEFPALAAELAAMAGIATRHPGDIPWKANAKHVRELAGAMNAEKLTRGNKSYMQVKEPFDKVVAILDGKPPAGLPEAEDQADFLLTADFGHLMARFQQGENTLTTNGGSEPAFKQAAADIAREGRVLAALAEVVATPDYGYGEDPPFQKYADEMRKAGGDIAAAAEAADFAKFDLARSALGQSCTQCHGEYRN